jgi:hypothetical protein
MCAVPDEIGLGVMVRAHRLIVNQRKLMPRAHRLINCTDPPAKISRACACLAGSANRRGAGTPA